MPKEYTLNDLNVWDEKIQEVAKRLGLDWYPQEFLICDHEDMLGYMTYHGMPSHYPHWSFGKSYEKTKTMYSYGAQGLPYEMVINSDPCIAYLMKDNTLLLQILTIAHVYGHNDFFKNNRTFAFTEASDTLDRFKRHANRIRGYIAQYGIEQVEKFIDAARALEFNSRRYPHIKKLTRDEFLAKKWDDLKRATSGDPWKDIHASKHDVLDSSFQNYATKNPVEPDEDVLTFIRDNNPYLTNWQRDILTIMWEESQYFIPQIETKIMNEGWASYWHFTILNELNLPQDLMWEFHIRHNQVLRPFKDQINPYYLGFKIFKDIEQKYGREKMFQVREADRDVSFIRQYLTQEMAGEMDLFTYERDPNYSEWYVSNVADEEGFIEVRESLATSVGMGGMPIIRVADDGGTKNRELVLDHVFDGRELDNLYTEKTLGHISYLWGRSVHLLTKVNGKTVVYTHDGNTTTKSFY